MIRWRNTSRKNCMVLGYQYLTCKNPRCGALLKTIVFFDDMHKEEHLHNATVQLHNENNNRFYRCLLCHAKNIVVSETAREPFEKIVRCELTSPASPCTTAGSIANRHHRL